MDMAMEHRVAAGAAPVVARRAVATWLLVCAALVFAMVVVGGATRLTHSGLSIVEWKPLVGAIPPVTEAQWIETFAKYQQTPEYRLVNHGMSLEGFKGIFWWEYFHRLLGRAIGVVFLLPMLVFIARRQVDAALAWKLGGIFVLGALQGAMGWYMVKSGLVDDPRVSHFRLTAHLGIAFLILASMLWVALDLLRGAVTPARTTGGPATTRISRLSWAVTGVVVWMVLTGGLVAGIRAGRAYNTFPLMNGHWIPPEILMIEPWWRNFFYNMATVQFDHRMGAWALAVLVPWLWWAARRADLSERARRGVFGVVLAFAIQFGLGVATLLTGVDVTLGVAHQGGAAVLFAAALSLNHALRFEGRS